MRRTTALVLTLGLVALAGCGSSKNAATTAATHALPPGATEIGTPPPVKSVVYRFSLSGSNGAPKGAAGGSASGLLAIKASTRQLCWRFSDLKGVATPTHARIYRSLGGGPGVGPGVALGPSYKPSGCLQEAPVFLGLLGKVPQNFYVSIDNGKFPHGAVRGRPASM